MIFKPKENERQITNLKSKVRHLNQKIASEATRITRDIHSIKRELSRVNEKLFGTKHCDHCGLITTGELKEVYTSDKCLHFCIHCAKEEDFKEDTNAKECSKCGETKLLSDFYKRSKSPDGKQTWCISCIKKAQKKCQS